MVLLCFIRLQKDLITIFPLFFLQVKRNISDLINIPVRHQQWEGWPVSASDDSVRDTFRHLNSDISDI